MEEQASAAVAEEAAGGRDKRVVYLLGAGATEGCISHLGSRHSIVMSALKQPIFDKLRERADKEYADHPGIRRLVNEVMVPESGLDIEHLMTFLEDSSAQVYRQFSVDLRQTFSSVLRSELDGLEPELGSAYSRLYAALIDMHDVDGSSESLGGFLTLNYDVVLEHAIEYHLRRKVDYGVSITGSSPAGLSDQSVRVLKMHGSFGWSQDWPIRLDAGDNAGFWIPPGIRKPKNEYPFNAIWGLARELLDCDILRIIGCNLGPNDWDLVSLIFSTKHTHATAAPYRIEVISGLDSASQIKRLFPYLEVLSLVELPRIGEQIVSELVGGEPRLFAELPEALKKEVVGSAGRTIKNPFEYWLTQVGEAMTTNLGSLATGPGIFEQFIESGR